MVLREVKPLSEKQWKLVTEQLTAGPTEESSKALKKMIKLGNELREES